MNSMKWKFLIRAICITLFLSTYVKGNSQDDIRTRLSLTATQVMPDAVRLDVRLLQRIDRRYIPLANTEITLFTGADDDNELGQATSNRQGATSFFVEDISDWAPDADSTFSFSAYFEGGDQLRGSSDQVSIRRARMNTDISEEDQTIEIELTDFYNPDLKLGDFEVTLSVPRMFSDLKIEEDYLDEEGLISFTFEDEIPGDEEGNLEFCVRVLDTDDHGNIEQIFIRPWGQSKSAVVESTRELWSPDAPLWMVFTFGILMLLAWGHFGYIIYTLVQLKKLG